MKRAVLDPRSLIVAPVALLIAYLVSLPVYYFGIVWHDGLYSFYVENTYIAVFGLAGFFGIRWFNKICKDDGSGNIYMCSAFLILLVIMFGFNGGETYAVNIAKLLYPEGVTYKSALSFENGLTMEGFTDLMKFSSVYICTYAASCCLVLLLLFRSLLNECAGICVQKKQSWLRKREVRRLHKEGIGDEDDIFKDDDDFEFKSSTEDNGEDSAEDNTGDSAEDSARDNTGDSAEDSARDNTGDSAEDNTEDSADKDFEEMTNEDMETAENENNVIRCVGEVRGRRPGENHGLEDRKDHNGEENDTDGNLEESAEADRDTDG